MRDWAFRRGFLERVTFRGKRFPPGLGDLFDRHPVQAVRFEDDRSDPYVGSVGKGILRGVRRARWAGRLTALELDSWLAGDVSEEAAALLSSPRLSNLRRLLFMPGAAGGSVPALLRSPSLARLTSLHLRRGWGRTDLDSLVSSPHLAPLRDLELELGGRMEETVLAPLTLAEHAQRWEQLHLRDPLTPSGLDRLGTCSRLIELSFQLPLPRQPIPSLPDWPRLSRLSVDDGSRHGTMPPGPGAEDAVRALLSWEGLPRLKRLRLWAGWLGFEEAIPVLSELLTRLPGPILELTIQAHLTAGTLQRWPAEVEGLENLRALVIRNTHVGTPRLTDEAVHSFVSCPRLGNLRGLHILAEFEDRRVSARTVAALVGGPAGRHLTALTLGTGLWRQPGAGEVVEVLAGWPGLARLTDLDLQSVGLPDVALESLVDSPHLCPLTRIYLPDSSRGPAASQLRERLGPRLRSGYWERP